MNIFTSIKGWFDTLNTKKLWVKIVVLVLGTAAAFWVVFGIIKLAVYLFTTLGLMWVLPAVAGVLAAVWLAVKAWRK